MTHFFPQSIFIMLLVLSLVACNSGDSAEEATAPKITAFNKSVTTTFNEDDAQDWRAIHQTSISVDVQDPDSSAFKYHWVVLSNHDFEISGLDEPKLTFNYQTTLSEEEDLFIVDLTIIDEDGLSDYQTFQYDLNEFVNVETPSQYVKPNQLVTMTPVITGKRHKIISYTWQELEGHDHNLTLFYTNDEKLEAQFYTPQVSEITSLYLSLKYTVEGSDDIVHKVMNIHVMPD